MNISRRLGYYISVVAFPLFYILHGVNENFGLIRNSTITGLLIYYVTVAVFVGLLGELLMKDYKRSIVFTFFILFIFFFFGVFKDSIKQIDLPASFGSYSVILVLVFITVLFVSYFIKTTRHSLKRTSRFLITLLFICLIVETGILIYNSVTGMSIQQEFGDHDHSLLKNINLSDTVRKPFIFWIVMDEYSGKSALNKKWNYSNPLDTILRDKGFFVADSATSSYNYTHYSLASTLDMMYLKGLQNHSVIGYKDIVRGNLSLRENNVVKFLEGNGYDIENYTIFNLGGYSTKAQEDFVDADRKLIDNQTLPGRVNQDIGWNFRTLMVKNKKKADSIYHAVGLANTAIYRNTLLNISLSAAEKKRNSIVPSFFMFQFMYTHEPFIYKADGMLDLTVGYGTYPEKYIYSVNYANKIMTGFIDSIKKMYAGKELVIILQGDHGFKFDDVDPLFDEEGCSILYAVYCSDGDYSLWNRSFNSVNGFRVLFNKYFHAGFPNLDNRSYNLYYK